MGKKKSQRSKTRKGKGRLAESDPLLLTVLSRGVEDRLNSKEALARYFLKLSDNRLPRAIYFSFLEGLTQGAPRINEIANEMFEEKRLPLLFAVCQWKLLSYASNWVGKDEVVDMVIKAGADVNHCLEDGSNALFYAVKYGSLRTVDLLLEAGINIHQRNNLGHTCLYNALEHPSPSIIRRLLEYLPADETVTIYKTTEDNDDNMFKNIGEPMHYNATLLDRIMNLIEAFHSLTSWKILGAPKDCDMSEVFMLLRQKGVHFSSSSAIPMRLIGYLYTSVTVDITKMGDMPMFKEVGKTFVGATVPKSYVSRARARPDEKDANKGDAVVSHPNCPICQNPITKKVTLYCGHSFCRKCIIDYGNTDYGDTCIVCRRRLCLDLHQPRSASGTDLSRDAYEIMTEHSERHMHGPRFMTDEQVQAEYRFRDVVIEDLNQSYEDLRLDLMKDYEEGQDESQDPLSMHLDLGLCTDQDTYHNVVKKFAAGKSTLSPLDGPVAIEVTIEDLPLIARISNRSVYTVLSRTLVENLGLKRIDGLSSDNFLENVKFEEMTPPPTFTCLEPFCMQIGDIEITLRTALEASPDPFGTAMFGIQLGQDFLRSGVWCPIDVNVKHDLYMKSAYRRVDGEGSWLVRNKKEMLRYYSHCGKSACIPIIHFYPLDNFSTVISLKDDVMFEQCYWCCRVFPQKGMKVCTTCYKHGKTVTYCNERCQGLAYKIHKKTHHDNYEKVKSVTKMEDVD